MSVPTESSAGATAIRPFTIPEVSEAELEALRARHGHALAREGDRRRSVAGPAAGDDAGARALLGDRV
jgi:hypothetical protein